MIARLYISQNQGNRVGEMEKVLTDLEIKNPHPDLLYFPQNSKLGITEARKIKDHFSYKSFNGSTRAVVLEDASNLTVEAQNSLLKTLEELPEHGLFMMGASSDSKLLPTVVSRCQVIRIMNHELRITNGGKEIADLLNSDIQSRFEYIEKLKDREEFLHILIDYFHNQISTHESKDFTKQNAESLKELIKAEEWAKHNVNIRAVLEYLMLKMPKK